MAVYTHRPGNLGPAALRFTGYSVAEASGVMAFEMGFTTTIRAHGCIVKPMRCI
jgi:hypothetical protein